VKIVLDTNVFVSGVFFKGPPHEILQWWREGKIQVVLSPEILDEYKEVGQELAARYKGTDLGPLLDLLALHGEIVLVPPLPEPVCTDPDDDKFFACAVAAKVPLIVSGDKHLLAASGYRAINVLRPRAFVAQYLHR
jgi:putative PIN family toxin of toxin-antitoxin system